MDKSNVEVTQADRAFHRELEEHCYAANDGGAFLSDDALAVIARHAAPLRAEIERLKGQMPADVAGLVGRVLSDPPQIPPFISVPDFDDRSEERACINGCLYLRADFAALLRQPAVNEAAALRKAGAALIAKLDEQSDLDFILHVRPIFDAELEAFRVLLDGEG